MSKNAFADGVPFIVSAARSFSWNVARDRARHSSSNQVSHLSISTPTGLSSTVLVQNFWSAKRLTEQKAGRERTQPVFFSYQAGNFSHPLRIGRGNFFGRELLFPSDAANIHQVYLGHGQSK
jgi:hypothetical protein